MKRDPCKILWDFQIEFVDFSFDPVVAEDRESFAGFLLVEIRLSNDTPSFFWLCDIPSTRKSSLRLLVPSEGAINSP